MQKFIAIDGQHGAGKSYIVNRLYEKLMFEGYSVIKTKEPTDLEIGLMARKSEDRYSAKTLTCLFAADRLQHCEQIKEWLSMDKIVISDRYIISGMVLQNMDYVDFDYIKNVNCGIIIPDLSVILHADSDVIKERLKGKKISRLAKQEQLEGYDRYLKYRSELTKIFQNIYFCSNNTLEECEKNMDFIIDKIKESSN